MGKSYAESSLKRFLKQKVRITLGLVVTFLITGVASFTADEAISPDEFHKKYNLDGLLISKEYLSGEGTISAGENNQYVTVEKTENETIIKNKSGNEIVKINNSDIFTKTGENISKALQEMNGQTEVTNGTITGADGTKIQVDKINKGILEGASETPFAQNIGENKIMVNSGIITGGYNIGQNIGPNGVGYNYGIINLNGKVGQSINGIGYNYGIINSGTNYTQSVGKGIGYNYGILYGAQVVMTGKIYNYGVVTAENPGQMITQTGEAYNYGIISTGDVGIDIRTTGTGYNYGIIKSEVTGIKSASNGIAYNYGLVESNNIGINGFGYNYGVVKVLDASKAFKGDIVNKGIVITENNGVLADDYNTGILLDSNNYNVIGKDVKTFETTGELVAGFGETNTFGKETSKGFVKDISVNVDNLQDKFVGAVVTENSDFTKDKAVFNYQGEGKELLLKETSLVGYFEKDGTLLNVGNNDLTLGGNTNITAVKGDMSLDVYAVNIGKGNTITIADQAKINGIINGGNIKFANTKGNYILSNNELVEIKVTKTEKENLNYVDITLETGKNNLNNEQGEAQKTPDTITGLKLSTENTTEGLVNRVHIKEGLTIGKDAITVNGKNYSIYDDNTNPNTELEMTIENMSDIKGDILLGAGKDILTIENRTNTNTGKIINLGVGEDKVIVSGKRLENNIFNYNIVNAETVELSGGTWGNWENAEGCVSFEDTEAGKTPNLVFGKDTTIEITLGVENEGSDFANYVNDDAHMEHAVITGKGETSKVKYLIGYDGLDSSKLSSNKYSFGEGINTDVSVIFKVDSTEGKETTVTVKTAEEMGLSAEDRIIYNAYLNEIKADGDVNTDVIDQINSYNSSEEFANLIRNTSVTGEAYYTAGSTLTKDITNTYVSAVEDFTKRAEKGQWLAQGKYINSDTEFDGGTSVKGYDGDITGTVGMIEYGVTENTSYGAVFGMGDAEMDIDGGGKLDGDNTYAGLYMKHRTANGIELIGNIGYMESDMDSVLRNDFNFSNSHNTEDGKYPVETGGKTFEKGTADSSAVVIGLKGRKDYRISDTVKLQPTLGARLTFINQDEAENEEMHFTIAEQDIIVVEGTAGMGVAKEFALSQGKLELNAGAEYTFAATNSNNEAKFKVFDKEKPLEDTDAAENTGTVYVGADYEHENGVGFNGKYEMMWSDKGDDSRMTAGVSYRF